MNAKIGDSCGTRVITIARLIRLKQELVFSINKINENVFRRFQQLRSSLPPSLEFLIPTQPANQVKKHVSVRSTFVKSKYTMGK